MDFPENPFLQRAEQTKRVAEKRAEKAALTRAERRAEAKAKEASRLDETDEAARMYRFARRVDLEKLLADEAFGLRCQEFLKFLRRMKITDVKELLTRAQEPWLRFAPQWVRREVLSRINHHICRVRLNEGLAPFDDALPWLDEKPRASEVVQEYLDPDRHDPR
jgi:hypothetical protein